MAGKEGPKPVVTNTTPVPIRCCRASQVEGAIDYEPWLLTVAKKLCGVTGHCTTLEEIVEVTMTVGETQVSNTSVCS